MNPYQTPSAPMPSRAGHPSRYAPPSQPPFAAQDPSPSLLADTLNHLHIHDRQDGRATRIGQQLEPTYNSRAMVFGERPMIGWFGPDGSWCPSGNPAHRPNQQRYNPRTHELTHVFWSTCLGHGAMGLDARAPYGNGAYNWMDTPSPTAFGQSEHGVFGQAFTGHQSGYNFPGTTPTGYLPSHSGFAPLQAPPSHWNAYQPATNTSQQPSLPGYQQFSNTPQQQSYPRYQQQPSLNPSWTPFPTQQWPSHPAQPAHTHQRPIQLPPRPAPPIQHQVHDTRQSSLATSNSHPTRNPPVPTKPWDNSLHMPPSLPQFILLPAELRRGLIIYLSPNSQRWGGHPAIVRNWSADASQISILCCTSFSSSTNIYERFAGREVRMLDYLLIDDGAGVPGHLELPVLRLAEGTRLEKVTYVKVDVERVVGLEEVRRYSGGRSLGFRVVGGEGMEALEAYVAWRKELMAENAARQDRLLSEEALAEARKQGKDVEAFLAEEREEEERRRREAVEVYNAAVAVRMAQQGA